MSARCRRTAAASHLPFSRQKGRGCRKEGGKEENARVVLGNVVPVLPESWLYGRLKDFTSRHAAVRRGVITALGVWQSRTHTHTHSQSTFCSTFRTLLIEKKTSFFCVFFGETSESGHQTGSGSKIQKVSAGFYCSGSGLRWSRKLDCGLTCENCDLNL